MKLKLIAILSSVLLFSCNTWYYKLDENYKAYIPYEGNEILIFKSTKGKVDTTFLNGIHKYDGCYDDALDIFTQYCEGYYLECTSTDPNYDRYLSHKQLVSVTTSREKVPYIHFDITLKGSWFYGGFKGYKLDSLISSSNTILEIDGISYNDVKIIEADEYAKRFKQRDNYVERFYWSLKYGFLGLDKKEENWRLIKKTKS
ncbi:hypothetical protein [Pontibacter flavimaris]|uniref:Lipoprotein n=1 Tax=Pontibacter flavimaris TaxID=1797110 RepID=A0A1Q5P889_9BACT|nr:hypothetical protein [Pontibacter flavimaris]OKL38489.1 hypothetical protein A3841_07175 [Pontibacter flavimaris]